MMVATVGVADTQVTMVLMFSVGVSLYVPVAVNCCVVPFTIDGLAGVTAIDCNVAAVTVSTSTGEVTPLKLAVMLLVPTPAPVASPPLVPLVINGADVARHDSSSFRVYKMFSDSSEDNISVTGPGNVDNLPTEGRMTIEANEKLILEHFELFVHQQDAEAV